jgi:hypothetical protein
MIGLLRFVSSGYWHHDETVVLGLRMHGTTHPAGQITTRESVGAITVLLKSAFHTRCNETRPLLTATHYGLTTKTVPQPPARQ